MENLNPNVKGKCSARVITPDEESESILDEIDAREVFGVGYVSFCDSEFSESGVPFGDVNVQSTVSIVQPTAADGLTSYWLNLAQVGREGDQTNARILLSPRYFMKDHNKIVLLRQISTSLPQDHTRHPYIRIQFTGKFANATANVFQLTLHSHIQMATFK